MFDDKGCYLFKTEAGWMRGIPMKDHKNTNQKKELERYLRLLKEIPDPNCGRIHELKERIRKKTFFTKEAVEEAAERLAARLLGKDNYI